MGPVGEPLAGAVSARAQMKIQLGDGCEGELLMPRATPTGAVVILRELHAPALFVYGERDHTISLDDVRRVRDALESARRSYRMKIFAEVPHGFLNDTMPGRYRPKEAAQAWQALLAFLTEVFAGHWNGRVRWEFEGVSAQEYDFSKNVRLE